MTTVASPSFDASRAMSDASSLIATAGLSVLRFFGSLKLTVALFAFSLILVFAGTLAQHHLNMLDVKIRYFTSWIALMHYEDLVPYAFFPHDKPLEGFLPIPGGALVGTLLMINLICAKITRFRVQAKGSRLYGGIAVIALGALVTGVIVRSGQSAEGLQGEPPIAYDQLWRIILGSIAAAWVGIVGFAATRRKWVSRISLLVAATAIGVYILYSLTTGYRIGDPGLRIVWQLAKGLGAGGILLIGCLMVFAKQGGNVLLHMGVGLLMFGQFVFGDRQLEQRLNLIEGQSANTFANFDQVEMTFIRTEGDDQIVTAIPATRLLAAAESGDIIRDLELPYDVRVKNYYRNSKLKAVATGSNPATTGLGERLEAVDVRGSGGTSSAVDVASAYVEIYEKDSEKPLGTHLISQWFSDNEILSPETGLKDEFDEVLSDKDNYKVGLRFARTVKPFWMQLSDVRRVDYSGSDTPRDFRSFVRIIDPETGEDRRAQIWMNNPLRFRGETFYQSNYSPLPGGRELTGLQIVQNAGWLIPYVACSITALGMCVHFAGTLTTFTRRRNRESARGTQLAAADGPSPVWGRLLVGGIGIATMMALVSWPSVMNSFRPAQRDLEFDYETFGKIPVQFGGRVMPLAAFANQTLTAISNKSYLPLTDAPGAIRQRAGDGKRMSSLQWLMEVAIDDERLGDLQMFRIDSSDVRDEFGLPKRASKLFTLNELRPHAERLGQLVEKAAGLDVRDQSFKDKKLMELDRRIRAFTMVAVSFRLPMLQEYPVEMFPEGTTKMQRSLYAFKKLEERMKATQEMTSPGIVPPAEQTPGTSVRWLAFAPASFNAVTAAMTQADNTAAPSGQAGVETFAAMIKSYAGENSGDFNKAVDEHLVAVSAVAGTDYQPWRVSLERWTESRWPTGVALGLYMVALVLGLLELMIQMPTLRRATWGILIIAVCIHTVALLSRILITGRAPVINIYSSAVFIGWAAVIAGLIQERTFRYGIGNLLAAGSGVLALLVAYGLSSGDTMPVLQAVLDTQFWLGTHVISVTLGYTATMIAGFLGIIYLIASWIGISAQGRKEIYRSVYGATCFGILFSFVGTVLGGLWADDSWGRFWGWDPKENGALLIVIWNALMLHARWDGIVAARGFSILAIGGNIVTAWSYFGTNELGIGLHSYGFTSGVLKWLSIFIASQVFFMVAGILLKPKSPSEDIKAA